MSGLFTLNTDFLILSFQALMLLAVVTWVFSTWLQDVSIVDYIWSLLTLLAVGTYSYLSNLSGAIGPGGYGYATYGSYLGATPGLFFNGART
jgi:uncharacterized protein YqgC (DUF456 family)